MIDQQVFYRDSRALAKLLQARLGSRGETLAQQIRRAGRRLPAEIRRTGAEIVGAETVMAHPRLARLVHPARLEAAFESLSAHLKTVDPADRRRHALLSALAVVVFNLLLLGLGLAVFLKWQGLV